MLTAWEEEKKGYLRQIDQLKRANVSIYPLDNLSRCIAIILECT